MLKRVGAIFISFMLAAGCVYGTTPQEYTAGLGNVKTTPTVFDGALTDGGTLSVGTSAVTDSETAETAVLMVMVYKDKKLESVKISDAKQLSKTATDFSVAVQLPDKVTDADGKVCCEVNASLVSLDGGFTPLSTPAFYPVRAEFKPLKDIRIDGASVADFDKDKTEYSAYMRRYASVEDYNNGKPLTEKPKVAGLAADSGTKLAYDTESDTLTATATDGTTLDYAISFKYRIHGVVGGAEESDFEDDADVYGGKVSTLTKTNKGTLNGMLCTNLHGNTDDSDGSISGSRWATDGTPLSGQRHEIYAVAEDLQGCDYYIFNNSNRAKYNDAGYEFVTFTAAEDIEVIIIGNSAREFEGFATPVKQSEIQLKGRYLNSPAPPCYALAGKDAADGTKYGGVGGSFSYEYRTSKAFAKDSKVTIKASAAGSSERSPVVVIKPL